MADVGKEYAGDGVYLAPGTYTGEIIVTNENGGVCALDTIVLEEIVWQRLVAYGVRYGFKLPEEVHQGL
jgi:hypothetical protein